MASEPTGYMPSEHVWYGQLFGDREMALLFAPHFEIASWCAWETALAEALGEIGRVAPAMVREIEAVLSKMVEEQDIMRCIKKDFSRDGMGVPAFVRFVRARLSTEAAAAFHQGGTSQDLIDTMWVLRLRAARGIVLERLDHLGRKLADITARHGDRPLMARTRMQAALPIKAADRIRLWQEPIDRLGERARQMGPRVDVLAWGGPVGDGRPFAPDEARAIARIMAHRLSLHLSESPWHAMRDRMFEQGAWFATVAGSLGKFARDVALMAQQGIDAIRLEGGGSSSAMAHKSNPVTAEIMEAMARKVSSAMAAMSESQLHEQERSGAAWALEWLALSEIVMLTGALSARALALADQIEAMGEEE